jgi:hypothetical protein
VDKPDRFADRRRYWNVECAVLFVRDVDDKTLTELKPHP